MKSRTPSRIGIRASTFRNRALTAFVAAVSGPARFRCAGRSVAQAETATATTKERSNDGYGWFSFQR